MFVKEHELFLSPQFYELLLTVVYYELNDRYLDLQMNVDHLVQKMKTTVKRGLILR